MASNFLSALSLLSFLFLFTSSFQISSVNSLSLPSDSSNKVSLGVYYESLCPGSIDFIVKSLPDIFENELISIVDLHLSPWGNAHILSDGTFDCQHGEKECLLNTIEACAIDVWPDLDTHFHFIYCVESMVFMKKFTMWETCFDSLGLQRTPVDLCYGNGHGKKLELEYANETASLKPPHQFVPWVVVDGKPLYDDYENFMSYICKAYKGSSPPKACNSLPLIRNVQVSYKENFSRSTKVYLSKDDASIKPEKFARSEMIQM